MANEATQEVVIGNPPPTRAKIVMRILGWSAFALACLIFFTLIKVSGLAETKIRNYVDGMISSQLAPRGITFSSEESSVSILTGLAYTMNAVTLSFPPPQPAVKIDRVQVSPSLLAALVKKVGASFAVNSGDGRLRGSFKMKDPSSGKGGDISLNFKASSLDAGKLGLLPLLAGVSGTLNINGNGSISGDTSSPTTLDGDTSLELKKIVLDAQSIQGFSVPKISISEGTVETNIEKGKVLLKNVKIGKPGSPDDLIGTASGEITLNRVMEMSALNLKVKFSLSQSILKSFVLLDALMANAKQPDGQYAYSITGTINNPMAAPLGK